MSYYKEKIALECIKFLINSFSIYDNYDFFKENQEKFNYKIIILTNTNSLKFQKSYIFNIPAKYFLRNRIFNRKTNGFHKISIRFLPKSSKFLSQFQYHKVKKVVFLTLLI